MSIRKSRLLCSVLVFAILMNSIAFAGPSGPGVRVLQSEVKTLRANIDSGKVSTADAIDAFAKNLVEKNITSNDVYDFVKARLTAREYEAFRKQLEASLHGIDPATLKPEELGELVGIAMSEVRSEGLSWSSCASTVTGAALVVAAVVVGVIAIVKSKSEEKVRSDYADKRTQKTNYYNSLANRSRNWESEIPADINYYNNEIYRLENDVRYYQDQYYRTDDETSRQEYARQIQQLNDKIRQYQYEISSLMQDYQRYSSNPSAAEADARAYEATRDQVLSDLINDEAAAVAKVPENRKLGKGLGIGAGLGAAVGAYILIDGIRDGGCRH